GGERGRGEGREEERTSTRGEEEKKVLVMSREGCKGWRWGKREKGRQEVVVGRRREWWDSERMEDKSPLCTWRRMKKGRGDRKVVHTKHARPHFIIHTLSMREGEWEGRVRGLRDEVHSMEEKGWRGGFLLGAETDMNVFVVDRERGGRKGEESESKLERGTRRAAKMVVNSWADSRVERVIGRKTTRQIGLGQEKAGLMKGGQYYGPTVLKDAVGVRQ
ncbi:hypothetical protein BJ684DRAFT_15662, partial [Piptocephalis cylindrospora]